VAVGLVPNRPAMRASQAAAWSLSLMSYPKTVGFLLFCGAILFFGYRFFYGPTYEWHQTIAIAVNTPEGLRTGTGTTQIRFWSVHNVPGSGTLGKSSVRGQAAFVEVRPGRFLFAVLDGRTSTPPHHELAPRLFSEKIDEATTVEGRWYLLSNLKGTAKLKPADYPLLVTFDDLNDPSSVKEVDRNNLEATFGLGVSLKSITLAINEVPSRSRAISSVLPWLSTFKRGFRLYGRRYRYHRIVDIANVLGAASFKVE